MLPKTVSLRIRVHILFVFSIWCSALLAPGGTAYAGNVHFDFYGDVIDLDIDESLCAEVPKSLTNSDVEQFYAQMNEGRYQPVIKALLSYKEQYHLNDWFYYQLIRKTAQQISPKADNYPRYTLYKWFLLAKSGYDATVVAGKEEILFYVQSDENIYDIPYYRRNGKQYVCLNYHDYGKVDFKSEELNTPAISIPEAKKPFSYKVTLIPDFTADEYVEKDIAFDYLNKSYHFKVKLNPGLQNLFTNYPVVDFESYFNIPLSTETYNSLIPALKKNLKGMSQKNGVDYLMRFTRNSFLYETDEENFGKERRLSPEQTLMNKYSDCDDRAGLFFYLVKEIYDLPMIVLLYPKHVTIAVKFDNPSRNTIVYKNSKYSVCEPTPQAEDMSIGQVSQELRAQPYQVAYEYTPQKK